MKGIVLFVIFTILTFNVMAQEKIIQTAGRDQLGEFAPKFAELNDDVLFGEVWSRNDLLSQRDRSMVTITSLISQGITDSSLKFHLQSAKDNGITRSEIAEIITHIAFYAGWPKAWAAFRLAKDVWAEDVVPGNSSEGNAATEKIPERMTSEMAAQENEATGKEASENETAGEEAMAAFQKEMIFPIGEPNTAYAQYFSGRSYIARLSTEQIPFCNVTFEPGCRNNWHIHRASSGGGQMLVGVAGKGWYQEEGKPAQEILPGTVIHIPANVKHWHGATPDSKLVHLSVTTKNGKNHIEWKELVKSNEYNL